MAELPAQRVGRRRRRRRDRASARRTTWPRAGVPDVVLLERRHARLRLDLQGGRRGARAVLRPGQHRARPAQPARLRAVRRRASGRRSTCTRSGYLFLLDDPDHVAAFEANVALQNELGVPEPDDHAGRGEARSRRWSTSTACWPRRGRPRTATARPESVVLGYAGAARRAGARIVHALRGHRHRGRRRRRSAAVLTDAGRIRTDTVVCAAGAWSRAVGEMVGRRPARSSRCAGRSSPPSRCPALDPDDAVHDRLRDQPLLPPRGPRPAARHVRPRRDAGLRARPLRRLAAAPR